MAASAIRIAQAYVQLDVRGQRRMENLLGKATKSVRASAMQMQRAGRAAFALGAASLGAFTLAAKGASDLRESTNKTIEVFGGSAQSVLDWSKTTARGFGIAKSDAQAYASELGLIIQQSGKTADESAKLSVEMSQLAADLASFNNVDIDTAFEKLKSGLVGESKPLREFGILLNETEVAARAIELGFKKVNGELSEAAKVSARYSLIIEQSGKAQGDFSRTSGDLANASRIAKAELRDMSDAIGSAVLPAFTSIVKVVASVASSIKIFAENNPGVTKSFFNMSIALVAVGSALLTAGVLTNTFASALANLNQVTKVATFLQTAFSTSVGAGTAQIKIFQASLVAIVAYAAYQVGTVLADIFYGAGEAAKDLNDELVRTQIIQKGLDEYNQSQLRKRFLTGEVTKKNEQEIRKEISRRKIKLNELVELYDELSKRTSGVGAPVPGGGQGGSSSPAPDRQLEQKTKERIEQLKREIANREIVQKEIDAILAEGGGAGGDPAAQATVVSYLEEQEEILKRQRIELEKGKMALQEYIDIQDGELTAAEAKSLRLKREKLEVDQKINEVAQKKIDDAKALNESASEQTQALRDQKNEITLGRIESERLINIRNGMSAANANMIAQAEISLELERKTADAAEERKAKADALKQTFKDQKRELELQIVALKQGEEAAQRLRDKEAGFTKNQRIELARLRKEQARLSEVEKDDDQFTMDKGNDQLKSIGSFFGGGFAQRLATGLTPAQAAERAKEQRQEQIKQLRSVARAYRQFNAGFGKFQKNQDSWHAFQKKVFGRIVSM